MAKVLLTKEQTDLLRMGSVVKVNKPEEKEYLYIPYWFEHDVKTDTWTMYTYDHLPQHVKNAIKELSLKQKKK